MYEIYNRIPSRITEYLEREQAAKALKNLPAAAVMVKDGKVLSYKSSLSTREQARIRDAIAEEYEAATRPPPAIEPQQTHIETPPSTVPEPVSEPVLTPPVVQPETFGWKVADPSPVEVSPETVAEVAKPEPVPAVCSTPDCNRSALRITPMTRPEHHGLCKYCRNRAYERARAKPTKPTKTTQPLAERIGELLIEAFAQHQTPEQREILELGQIIGLETLRVLAKRVKS